MTSALCARLGIEFPLFAFSHCRDVVAEVSRAGGMGVFGAASMTAERLEEELAWIDAHVDGKPYGVDLLIPDKVLGKSDWVGREYSCRFDSAGDMRAWMLEVPVGLVILDLSTPSRYWRRHHELLVDVLTEPGSPWILDHRRDVVRAGDPFPQGVEVYRLEPKHLRPARELSFDEVSGSRHIGSGP